MESAQREEITSQFNSAVTVSTRAQHSNVSSRLFSENMLNFNVSFNAGIIVRDCKTFREIEERRVTTAEIIACIIALFTVLENAVILYAIATGPRSLRKPPYWFIASLAAADFLTGIEITVAIFAPVGESPLSRIALKVCYR